jgi:hypothetical protein
VARLPSRPLQDTHGNFLSMVGNDLVTYRCDDPNGPLPALC